MKNLSIQNSKLYFQAFNLIKVQEKQKYISKVNQ